MSLGPIKNGKHMPITPRDGKAWCDVVKKERLPKPPAPTGSYLWLNQESK